MASTNKILLALLLGAAAGAAAGILLAPDEGSETRKKISDTANDLKEKVKGPMKTGPHNAEAVKEEIMDYVS